MASLLSASAGVIPSPTPGVNRSPAIEMRRLSHCSASPLQCSTNSSALTAVSLSRSPVAHLVSLNLARRDTKKVSTSGVRAAVSWRRRRSASLTPGQYFLWVYRKAWFSAWLPFLLHMPVLIWATTADTCRTGSTSFGNATESSILLRHVDIALLS